MNNLELGAEFNQQGHLLEVNLKSRPFLSQMKPFPNVQILTRLMQ